MNTPVPPHIAENASVIGNIANALADALDNNANPYRAGDKLVDVNALVKRLLELSLGEENPIITERPAKVDPYSALFGAATVLGISLRHGGKVDWICNQENA